MTHRLRTRGNNRRHSRKIDSIRRRSCPLESLESREVMASDLDVWLDSFEGSLYVVGTSQSDQIDVRFADQKISVIDKSNNQPVDIHVLDFGQLSIAKSISRDLVPFHVEIRTGDGKNRVTVTEDHNNPARSLVIIGGSDSDMLNGGSANDAIYGMGGTDVIYGGSGDDYLAAGTGGADESARESSIPELVFGGAGNDTLFGTRGADILWGGEGIDVLDARDALDFVDAERQDSVRTPIDAYWAKHGGETGTLGRALSPELVAEDGTRYRQFGRARVTWDPVRGLQEIRGLQPTALAKLAGALSPGIDEFGDVLTRTPTGSTGLVDVFDEFGEPVDLEKATRSYSTRLLEAIFSSPPATASAASPPAKQNWRAVPHLDQRDNNSCGTTTLAMILNFLFARNDFRQSDIDSAIRRVNSFGTAPTALVDYARHLGVAAEIYNDSSLEELKDHIRRGHAVQVAVNNPYDSGNDLIIDPKDHYLIVTGFETVNGHEYALVRDPNGDDNSNVRPRNRWSITDAAGKERLQDADYAIPISVFLSKWGPDTDDGYKNFMVVYAQPGSILPPSRLDGNEHSIGIASAYWNMVNNADRLVNPDDVGSWLHGAAGTAHSAQGTVVAGLGWLMSAGGQGLRDWGDKLPAGAAQGVKIVGSKLNLAGEVLAAYGSGMSNVADKAGEAIEAAVHLRVKDSAAAAAGGVKAALDAQAQIVQAAVNAYADPLVDIGQGLESIGSKLGPAGSFLSEAGRYLQAEGQSLKQAGTAARNSVDYLGRGLVDLARADFHESAKNIVRGAVHFVESGEYVLELYLNTGELAGRVFSQGGKVIGHWYQDGRQVLDETWESGKKTAESFWNGAREEISTTWRQGETVVKKLTSAGELAASTTVNTAGKIYQEFRNGLETVRRQFDRAGQIVSETIRDASRTVVRIYSAGRVFVERTLDQAGKLASETVLEATRTIARTFENGRKTVERIWNEAGKLASETLWETSRTIARSFDQGRQTLERVWNAAGKLTSETIFETTRTIARTFENGRQVLERVWNSAGRLASETFWTATETISRTWQNGRKTLERAWNQSGRLVRETIWEAGRTIHREFANGVKTLERVWDATGKLIVETVWDSAGRLIKSFGRVLDDILPF